MIALDHVTIILSVISAIISLGNIALALYCVHYTIQTRIDVESFKKSTHKVQFMPATDYLDDAALNQAIKNNEEKAYDQLNDIDDDDDLAYEKGLHKK